MPKKTIVDDGENLNEVTAQKHRTQRFLDEIKTRGGLKSYIRENIPIRL